MDLSVRTDDKVISVNTWIRPARLRQPDCLLQLSLVRQSVSVTMCNIGQLCLQYCVEDGHHARHSIENSYADTGRLAGIVT